MKVLFTGFDPFGGATINPAYEAVKLLPDTIAGAEIIKVEIPTVFRKGAEAMLAAVEEHKPDVVICVGQAGGRATMNPEFVAINYQDARIADNEGNQPLGETIKDHRTRCGVTQEFVAEQLSVSRQAVSKWENGTSDPSTANLLALAKLFGVSAAELLKNVAE